MSIQVSKMSLIDLAGSERASTAYKTYRSQGLHREGGNINKSLLSLGNCINALTNNKNGYIPYRSSKLTLILRDSLGGNCRTLMIATISSSGNSYEEIHNTLLYAERAKGVQLNVRKNNISVAVQPREYKNIIEKMSREIENLKRENDILKNQAVSIPENPIISSADAIEKLNSIKNVLDDLFKRRTELREKLLDCEHNLKFLDLRIFFRTLDNQRLKLLEMDEENDGKQDRNDLKSKENLHSIYSQKLYYMNLKSSFQKEVDENQTKINKLEKELLEKTNNDLVVRCFFKENKYETQSSNIVIAEKHYKKIIEEFLSRYECYEDLNSDVMSVLYKFYHMLNGLGHLSEEMNDRMKSIVHKIKGRKNVVWRDNVDSPTFNKQKDLERIFSFPMFMSVCDTSEENEKRNLVAVHDITPTLNKNKNNLYNNHSHNQNTQHNSALGNTVTKARNVAIVSPAFGLKQPLKGKENQRSYFNNNSSIHYNNNSSLKNRYNHNLRHLKSPRSWSTPIVSPGDSLSVVNTSSRQLRSYNYNNRFNHGQNYSSFSKSPRSHFNRY
ncbi:kinesin-like protein KIF18A-like protein [Sarcoptes scabiei]|nr:kinesin-like protein KIF18A-like protein [Sarcoptes scabiei]